MKTHYTSNFENLRNKGAETFVLRGASVLVEILEEEEIKTEGGIILQSDPNQVRGGISEYKGLVGLVLLAGEGYYDNETKENIPLDVAPGNIVLLPKYSVSYYSVFPGINGPTNNRIGLVNEAEIRFVYKSLDAYETARSLLNESVQSES